MRQQRIVEQRTPHRLRRCLRIFRRIGHGLRAQKVQRPCVAIFRAKNPETKTSATAVRSH